MSAEDAPPSVRRRVRRLTRKLVSSPVLPIFLLTRALEAYVPPGAASWTLVVLAGTAAWAVAEELQDAASD